MKKRVLFINSVCGIRSTGRICIKLAESLEAEGYEVKIAYGRESVPVEYQKYAVRVGNKWDNCAHALKTRFFDGAGFESKKTTKNFLKWADQYAPDILWLHNLHGYYINIEMLFQWIKSKSNLQVKWTLHDCWAFTGHCSYFSAINCEQWKDHCLCCAQKKHYPASFLLDNCKYNFERKKKAFTEVENMTLITPSEWLANLVKQSFLGEYPIEVQHNSIDTNIFRPIQNNFRRQFGLNNKIVILGVASVWSERKGLDDFIQLCNMLDNKYAVILVGINRKQVKKVSKKIQGMQKTDRKFAVKGMFGTAEIFTGYNNEIDRQLVDAEKIKNDIEIEKRFNDRICRNWKNIAIPENVDILYETITGKRYKKRNSSLGKLIIINRTNDSEELAKIYSCADVFVNPTHEDNYPTVNLEAKACGCPVITYDTGGCKETI